MLICGFVGKDIEQLKKKKASDYDTVKAKLDSQTAEFNQLAEKYNKVSGEKADKKRD